MENDDDYGQAVPTTMEEAVTAFNEARQERIGKRRARITERIAQQKKAETPAAGDTASIPSSLELLLESEEKEARHSTAKSSEKFEKRHSHEEELKRNKSATETLDTQIEESRKQLEQMILDGETLITNVRVAAEYREKARQKDKNEKNKERLERLRNEAAESQTMYDALSQNWAMKAEKALPMDIYRQMKSQQDACNELLLKKDELITAMRREVDENEFEYDHDLELYQKDSMLMGDRMDDLVGDLRVAFVEELTLIEDYTTKNRQTILQDNQDEWMKLLKDFQEMGDKNLMQRKSDALAKFQTLNDLFTLTKQEARMLRHKMEDDLRILIQEREQIKYACQLNLEKIAYNLHILQCRSKENVQLKNMMKRFLLQLHDKFDARAASLKKKMILGKKQCDKLLKEIDRLEMQVSSFGRKTLHLALSDYRKFIDLWTANEEVVRVKVKAILDSEKYVFETQLGIEFEVPPLTCFDERPVQVDATLRKRMRRSMIQDVQKKLKRESAKSIDIDDPEDIEDVEEMLETKEEAPKVLCVGPKVSLLLEKSDSLEFLPGPDPDPVIQRRLMKSIAKIICAQSGFILEEELCRILDPLPKTEKNLVNLDAVLQSLGITNVEEMQTLARFMLKYCKVMKGVMSRMGTNESMGVSEMNVSAEGIIAKGIVENSEQTSPEDSFRSSSKISLATACTADAAGFCDCRTKEIEEEIMKNAKRRKQPLKVTSEQEKYVAGQLDAEMELKRTSLENIPCSPICCGSEETSPKASLEEILEQVGSDTELEDAMEDANEEQSLVPYGDDNEPDASLLSNKATVLSWLDTVNRDEVLGRLHGYQEMLGENQEEEDYGMDYTNVLMPKRKSTNEVLQDMEREMTRTPPPAPYNSDDEYDSPLGDFKSETETKTISIPSFDSKSDDSEEFLYIDPDDVTLALKNFCEDYSNRKKVVVPTEEEIITQRLANILYPGKQEVGDYWDKAIRVLQPKGKEVWDTVQHCFEQYNLLLKERNEHVDEIARLYKQNYELSHLLQKHLHAGSSRCTANSQQMSMDPSRMNYC